MSSRVILFLGAAAGTVVGLSLLLSPRAFRMVMMGLGTGITASLTVTSMNTLRQHKLKSSYVQLGLTAPPPNYKNIRKDIFSHLTQHYEDRGELDLGEEAITVEPHVFAQIGIIDIDGVRRMWSGVVVPIIQQGYGSQLFKSSDSSAVEVEKEIVFCDIGCGVGNVCMQVLAETHCAKTVGIDVIPSRICAAETATGSAKKFYPEIFSYKEAHWHLEDLVNSAKTLNDAGVNVVFTHSWMFDDDLMKKLTTVIDSCPSIACVVTSRKLDMDLLKNNKLQLQSLSHLSADWNDEAPFYAYGKPKK